MTEFRNYVLKQTLILTLLAMVLLWFLGLQASMNSLEFVLRSLVLGHGLFWILFTLRTKQLFFIILGGFVIVFGWLAIDWLVASWPII